MKDVKLIHRTKPPYPFEAYSYIISPLSQGNGGGFVISIPDIVGFMSDGATEAEAIANGKEAFISTISAMIDMGRDIPAPSFSYDDVASVEASGKFITRVPKSMHAKLTIKAKAEGVSLNSLVISYLSESLGSHP